MSLFVSISYDGAGLAAARRQRNGVGWLRVLQCSTGWCGVVMGETRFCQVVQDGAWVVVRVVQDGAGLVALSAGWFG